MDKERILAKIDRLDRYLHELKDIMPENFETFQKIEKNVPVRGFFRFR